MIKLISPLLVCAIPLLLTGCASHGGAILPLPNGTWAIHSQCASWGILLPVRDMSPVAKKVSNDHDHIYLHVATGDLNISVWMEPINGYCDGSAQYAIEKMKKTDKSILAAQTYETFEIENQQHEHFTAIEYFLKSWPATAPPAENLHVGDEINQLNVKAVLFKDGHWADIHISAGGPTVGEEKLANLRKSFRAILANTQVISQNSLCR
ncbi:MAG: hypothetical protein OEV28_07015 [Nitrospirota bacterium]|nr:hypothetical protein [Nitrospirota bacterium]